MLNQRGTIVSQSARRLQLSEDLGSIADNNQLHQLESPEERPAADNPQSREPSQPASAHELTRKAGDLSLYKFYLNSVGPLLFIIWLVFAAGYIFSGKVPRTCRANIHTHILWQFAYAPKT
jgi:hypothetical protein